MLKSIISRFKQRHQISTPQKLSWILQKDTPLSNLRKPFQPTTAFWRENYNSAKVGKFFKHEEWNQRFEKFLKEDKFLALFGPSCSGKSIAVENSLLNRQGVLFIDMRAKPDILSGIQQALFPNWNNVQLKENLMEELDLAVKRYHEQYKNPCLIVLDHVECSVTEEPEKTDIQFFNHLATLGEEGIVKGLFISDTRRQFQILNQPPFYGYGKRYDEMLDSFLFPQVSDLELKEYFKKESKLTPQQIDKLIECIGGSNLLAMEIILKGKNFEDAINAELESAKSWLYELFVSKHQMSEYGIMVAHWIYTKFAQGKNEVKFYEDDGELFSMGMPSNYYKKDINWLVRRHYISLSSCGQKIVPYSKCLIFVYKNFLNQKENAPSWFLESQTFPIKKRVVHKTIQ